MELKKILLEIVLNIGEEIIYIQYLSDGKYMFDYFFSLSFRDHPYIISSRYGGGGGGPKYDSWWQLFKGGGSNISQYALTCAVPT